MPYDPVDKALDIHTLELAAGILEKDNPDQTAMNVVRWLRTRAAQMRKGNDTDNSPAGR
jgi:hypothetical protein